MMDSEKEKVIEKLFESVLKRYKKGVNLFLMLLMHCILILIK